MTPSPTSDTPDPDGRIAQLLVQAGWSGVLDRVLSGICHDLNGRVSSLDGLIQLVKLDGDERTPVVPYLETEVAKLEECVRLLRLIPGAPSAPPEPLPAEEVARRVAVLQSKHRGHESVEIEVRAGEGLPPVLLNWSRAGRALLIVAARVVAGIQAAGGRRATIALEGDPEEARLTFGPACPSDVDPPRAGWLPKGVAAALSAVLIEDAATLEPEDSGVTVTMPSLARARREGR